MHSSPKATTPRGTPSRRGKSPRITTPSPAQHTNAIASPGPSNNPSSSFFSCLSIPVEGAIPLDDNSSLEKLPSPPADLLPAVESKRAPRKSKTDALAALNSQARASSVEVDGSMPLSFLEEKYRLAAPIPVSPALDLSSVKTKSPRHFSHPKSVSRPFGLQDCPEYFPTAEEFKDPMSYIRSISDKAREYGICKIVPPEGWNMSFVTDTEKFRFKTRVQRLNSIEASSRAKLNFLEQLYRFHKQQGNPRVVVPTINHKPLDLWLLRKEVHKLGGYEAVCKNKKWLELGQILGYSGIQGLSTQIKNSYVRVILPYEDFCERGRNTPMSPPRSSKTPGGSMTTGKLSRLSATPVNPSDDSIASSPLTASSSPLSEPPEESELKEQSSKPRRSTRQSSQDQITQTPKKAASTPLLPASLIAPQFNDEKPVNRQREAGNEHCEICGKKNRGEQMLLCDGCDCGFHMFCLDPPLDSIPKSEHWYCYSCLYRTGGDYGFDEGEEHSLSSFQARDAEFRRMWFNSHPPPPQPAAMKNDPTAVRFGNTVVSEYDVENEFWRLVQTSNETVEIEYGADIHSTTHGSAMPTLETHPLDPSSKDPWNLNNIPVAPDSLLRYIKSDISGMTVPWTYVGMAFSTFCWHNEDHYTYSINFMHWGETKTWYGIPGDDAEKFEAAIKYEAPDLFETQPDLLFQLVTLMNPKRLTDAGVRVYACNQRAGEFVLTFPKAYHAGFNHGLNFNEAVNFALPDWLPYGRDCVQRYQAFRKLPVFSQDELLITITQHSTSIKTAMWLTDSLQEMTDREMNNRFQARTLGCAEILEPQDRSEDQYQCSVCKVFCYLSQITCPHSTNVVCVDHLGLLCAKCNDPKSLTLRLRFADRDLLDIQAKVAERAAVPSAWRAKLDKALSESARPSLRHLRALFAEGDRIHVNYYLPEIYTLRKCVTRASEWVDAANSFITRKQGRKRPRRSRGRQAQSELDDSGEKPEKSLSELYDLLSEVNTLGFDCPEISSLRALAHQAEELKIVATNLLQPNCPREGYMQQCQKLVLDASSLNVMIDEVVEVEKIVDREQLLKELEEKLEDGTSLTLDEVRQLLKRGDASSIPPDNRYMRILQARLHAGTSWEDRAKDLLAQPIKTMDDLDQFANLDPSIPIDPTVLDRLMSARAKARDFEKTANAWLDPEPGAPKPRPADVIKLAKRAEKEFDLIALQDVRSMSQIANELEERSEQLLKCTYVRAQNEDVFKSIKEWKAYANEHLAIFSLPNFEKVDAQVKAHQSWLSNLPWYNAKHRAAHGQAILDDVIESTRPEDDQPPGDEYFTCICTTPVRPPPPGVQSDAVQCDHCFARFHGECAKNGGSCPFCDHHHWNGEIHKERSWHFCYLPNLLVSAPELTKKFSEEWKQLEIIVHRIDRLMVVIGQFLAYTSQPANQHPTYIHQVRHYMRKLYKIQFAVSPNPDVSFGLDLAGLHRILAGRPKKRRKPKFLFGQDTDSDWADGTRCICRGRTPYLLGYPAVQCDQCSRSYHAGCVFFPQEPENIPSTSIKRAFTCPLCCLRKNKHYPYSEVRVKPQPGDNRAPDVYIDTKEMLDAFSKNIMYKTMGEPYAPTLFVELVKFTPGQPEGNIGGSAHSSTTAYRAYVSTDTRPPLSHPAHAPMTIVSPPPGANMNGNIPNVPPPPWSRWSTVTTPSRPPSTNRRSELSRTNSQPPPSARKRKHHDDSLPPEDRLPPMASLEPSPKRRIMHPQPPLPPPQHQTPLPPIQTQPRTPVLQPPPSTQTQTLSPSLARLMSPVDQISPRPKYIPPPPASVPPRNGHESHHSSPRMRPGGVDILNSPPMRGIERESPRMVRNSLESGPLPPPSAMRNGHDISHRSPPLRNGIPIGSPPLRNGIDATPIRKLMMPGKP